MTPPTSRDPSRPSHATAAPMPPHDCTNTYHMPHHMSASLGTKLLTERLQTCSTHVRFITTPARTLKQRTTHTPVHVRNYPRSRIPAPMHSHHLLPIFPPCRTPIQRQFLHHFGHYHCTTNQTTAPRTTPLLPLHRASSPTTATTCQ
jgi:hypothetical protein